MGTGGDKRQKEGTEKEVGGRKRRRQCERRERMERGGNKRQKEEVCGRERRRREWRQWEIKGKWGGREGERGGGEGECARRYISIYMCVCVCVCVCGVCVVCACVLFQCCPSSK